MRQNTAFLYTEGVVAAMLQKMNGCNKPMVKFISTLIPLWWAVSGRYNFLNLSRYCGYAEQSIRNAFERSFDFFGFNYLLMEAYTAEERVLVFDPTFISKSGKKTPGLGIFWNGTAQEPKKGLEIGVLGYIDVASGNAFHLEAVQTPSTNERKGKSMIVHYVESLLPRIKQLRAVSKHMVVDGYFMKKEFIIPIHDAGMHIITRMRVDANLHYMANQQNSEPRRGRPKVKAEKVNLKAIDKRRWKLTGQEGNMEVYTAIVYSVILRRDVRAVYLFDPKSTNYFILLSTDISLEAMQIVRYYRLRFQIEFLIRDAKQHSGLQDCQARSKNKLYFHFNIALTSASTAKISHYISIPQEDRTGFSLQSIKRMYHNKLLTETIFENLALDLNCRKIKRLYEQCLEFGRMAA